MDLNMIDWANLNFIPEEFECRCGCGQMGMNHGFLQTLQDVRTSYGRVMNVSSGYRCAAHPIEARKIERGGKPGSHYSGKAVDILVSGEAALELLRVALAHPKVKGIGVNQKGAHSSHFIHIDTLTEPNRPTIWSY
jgi:zinc D-Ala-D-Ala carboxypeptidase